MGIALLGLTACQKDFSVGPEQGTPLWPNDSDGPGTPDGPEPTPDPADFVPFPTPSPEPMKVFLSSVAVDGLMGLGGGVAQADATCNGLASNAGMGGTWVAFLSDSSENFATRANDVGPWYRMDGQLAFDSLGSMLTGFFANPPSIDETGTDIPTGAIFWTGTSFNGLASSTTCNDWSTNGMAIGTFGDANVENIGFYEMGTIGCANKLRLLCVQQVGGAVAAS